MSDKVDLSLDDIIQQSPNKFSYRGKNSFRGRGTSFRGNTRSDFRQAPYRGVYRGGISKPYHPTNFGVDLKSWTPTRGRMYNNQLGRLHISNLDYNVTNADIRELFSEFGSLIKSTVHYDPSGRSQGTAEVVYEYQNEAQKALNQYNNVPLDGRPMKILIMANKIFPVPTPTRTNFNRGMRRGVGGRGANRGVPPVIATREELDAQLDEYKMEVK